MKTERRLDARVHTVTHVIDAVVDGTPTKVEHVFELMVARQDGVPVEVSYAGRGKVGHGMDLLLQDVGIWTSRALQRRDPMTGEELKDE